MSDINNKIIEMILNNRSANEISSELGLTNKQLFYRLNLLKTKGYNFSRKYYSDGEITYKLHKGFQKEKEIALLTKTKENEIKAIFISDLHLTNKKDRIDLLKQIYELCINENIHIIINAGDIIDGLIGSFKCKKIEDSEAQIEYLLKNYPFDKNILNFICLGNHDYSLLENCGQNMETILSIKRHDIISLGYGLGRLKIKNDEIIVRHTNTPTTENYSPSIKGFTLIGHTHTAQNHIYDKQASIYIPSLSDMKVKGDKNYPFPSFLKSTISFNKGYISHVVLEQFIFLEKMYKVNEAQFNLDRAKDTNNIIKYEDDRITCNEEKVKVLQKCENVISQVDKFNKRYSKK